MLLRRFVIPVVFGATAICHGVAMLWRSLPGSPVVFGATAICHGVAMLWRSLALSLRSLRPFLLDSRQLRRHSVRMPCQFTLLASTHFCVLVCFSLLFFSMLLRWMYVYGFYTPCSAYLAYKVEPRLFFPGFCLALFVVVS